jgi:predicted nucleic acid-binding protein
MIVCDTGPLFAVLNADDKHHEASMRLLDAYDHRHFRAVRPAHCIAFELLPS